MHRKILLALAVLVALIFTMNLKAQAQQPAPATPGPVVTQAPALDDNPYGDVLTFNGFVKRTGVMAYPLIILSMIAFFMIVLFGFTVRRAPSSAMPS